MVQLLASDKTLLNGPDIDLYTPLHRAAECGHLAVCLALVDAGADLNASHAGLDGCAPRTRRAHAAHTPRTRRVSTVALGFLRECVSPFAGH